MRPWMIVLAGLLLPMAASAQEAPHHVGSQACGSCHAAESQAWSESHHALAWTPPTDRNVLADFDDADFAHGSLSVHFAREGDRFIATVREGDRPETAYPVHSVAGIAPLQQYLFETETGRLQSFDVVWNVERKRWYPLYPDQDVPPGDGLHWTGTYKNWNGRCAECHATGFAKNYDPRSQSYRSTQAEIGVGCEACHGPASAHLDWTANGDLGGVQGVDAYGFTMKTEAGPDAWIQQCAGCHARREPFEDGNPLPGTPFHDAYRLSLLQPDLYFSDGQIRDEVYEYGSFLQSKMYDRGVSCTNCHDPHSARLKADGNAVCTQCHSPAGNAAFPTLRPADYDTPEHHFHPPGSEGAQCAACHMPERTYMGIDARRDHSFRIPRPDLSAKTGAPDTCTSCHADRPPEWAAARIAEWYPASTHRGPHYGEAFALARTDPLAARPDLMVLASDESRADIVRATALYLLETAANADVAGDVAPLLSDASPLVRRSAVRLQRAASDQDKIVRLTGHLRDPSRSVRFSVAQELLGAPIAYMPERTAADMRAAMTEWQRSLASRLDFPETHLVLGGIALQLRNLPAALGAFREAVKLDPQQVGAWVTLVRLTAATDGAQAARTVLAEARTHNPANPALDDLGAQIPEQ
ncbi:cytochrome c3 family protein [Marinivivus vitaminiproducens]|uniref:cytochrome c3 family protein n=1 Tax=Marinivivus vitaminiproducens TaxID=3035935 RepID=UPI0027A82FEE|nr:multiheme c-type cytochrome [Geminicoccaceae bacterium SCSIO 64248]